MLLSRYSGEASFSSMLAIGSSGGLGCAALCDASEISVRILGLGIEAIPHRSVPIGDEAVVTA